jgi:hypothetical protein
MSELLNSADIPEKADTALDVTWLPNRNFKLDLNMLNYGIAEKTYELDWNKLIYGTDQMLDFLLNKEEERLPCRYYNYLFKSPSHRTDLEQYFLRERGIEIIDDSDEDDGLDKRLTIMYLEQTKELKE